MLEKYNYTAGKNLLNPTGSNQYGLFKSDGITKQADTFQTSLNLASSGDNDKPLAGLMCNIYNLKDKYSIQVNGWYIRDVLHLMLCNPMEVLENIAGSKGIEPSTQILRDFINKGTKGYDDYFNKYKKYKLKYLKLKELL